MYAKSAFVFVTFGPYLGLRPINWELLFTWLYIPSRNYLTLICLFYKLL